MKQLQGSGVLFAGAAVILMAAQPVWAAATQVTAVQLSPTNLGLNVVLQTSTGDRPQIFTNRRGNTLVADIINTQLRLPQGNSFRQDKPAPGIASVEITQFDSNSIRMVVIGTTSAPSSQIAQRDAQGITLSISPSLGTAAADSTPPAPSTPTPAASPQPRQTPTAQKPDVLVPNPKVTIDGKPAPANGTAQPGTPPPPPLLPRAVAPPVGDIAISNVDSSPALVDLGTAERVPRLVLRDAPVREVLALLARAAGLNLAFTTAAAAIPGQEQVAPPPGGAEGGPRISLDIENESVQDVFNYVLRLSGLQANRTGRTIFVGPRLPNEARDIVIRSYRVNQVTAGVALNFLVGMGAESAVSRERTITSVQAVPVGGAQTPATQTQTTTETRVETQRIDFQDSLPLLRGLQAVGDERTNSVTLVGTSKQVDIATAQLIQLDSRRRQVAVNVKVVDIDLVATDNFNTSFSFGIGNTDFSTTGLGSATNPGANFGIGVGNLPDRFIGNIIAQVQNRNAKILTDPTLIVQEGQQANVNLTEEVLGDINVEREGVGEDSITTIETEKEEVGLTLAVRIERIDDNGFVSLSVAPIVRAPQGQVNIQLPENQGQQTITLIAERSLNSGIVRLRDSQTLILSGIIQDQDQTTVSKVPILGDIPILGALFRRTNKENSRNEVVVLLTPQIIDDSDRSSSRGYNYTPSPDVRQLLERRGLQVPPGNNQVPPSGNNPVETPPR